MLLRLPRFFMFLRFRVPLRSIKAYELFGTMNYLSLWWKSRNECPKFIFDFRCNDGGLDTSKTALVDWWSLTHVLFGMLFSIPLFFIDVGWSCLICLGLSILYEIIENTNLGVCIGEIICCSPNYRGDNFWNSVADVMFNMCGFCIMLLYVINSGSFP